MIHFFLVWDYLNNNIKTSVATEKARQFSAKFFNIQIYRSNAKT